MVQILEIIAGEPAMEKNRLFWSTRRGMLELDLILQPFLEQVYPDLDEDNKRRFQRLLESEDQEMFAWFLRRENPRDPDTLKIVQLIRDSRVR